MKRGAEWVQIRMKFHEVNLLKFYMFYSGISGFFSCYFSTFSCVTTTDIHVL